jgi:hypothetical protein
MPSNLPGSNIRDLNKNGCFIWERVRFTITGGVALGLKSIQSRTQPGEK